MSSYIPADLRRSVAARAGHRCEYCLIREEDTFFGCEIDHVISLKHGGATTEGNLAYSCMPCNRQKGSDLGSISPQTSTLVRFFNPRADRWEEHFELAGTLFRPLTDIGEVTARILGFNSEERILEREELISSGRYP